jgi:hypothetical protein
MYTIFLTWAFHEDCELHMEVFPSENKKDAEKHAIRWLYITARTFLNTEIPNIETESDLNSFFIQNTLADVISFMHKNSPIMIKYKTYGN